MVQAQEFPLEVLGHRHAPRPPRRAIGNGIVDAIEPRLDVVGKPLSMAHGHDDGRTSEGAVTGGKDLRIFGPHGLPVGPHAIAGHEVPRGGVVAGAVLADRGNDHAADDVMLGSLDRHGSTTAILIGFAGSGVDTAQSQVILIVGENPDLLRVVDELDAFLDGALEFDLSRRDVFRTTAVDDLDLLATRQAQGGAAGVHGDIAAADDDDRRRHFGTFSRVDPAQELDAVDHAVVILAGDPHGLAPPGTDGEPHRIVAFLEPVQRDVPAQGNTRVDGETGTAGTQSLHVFLQGAGRQAKRGNAPDHHATRAVRHLVDINPEAGDGKIMGCHQSGRSGSNDADTLFAGDLRCRRHPFGSELVHDKALEIADLQGTVACRSPTCRFTGCVADASADRTEGIGCRDGLEGLGKPAFPDVRNVGWRVRADRAGDLAGSGYEMPVGGIVRELFRH